MPQATPGRIAPTHRPTTGNTTTPLTAEAAALVQQAARAMHKALDTLALANGRPLTITDLHRLTGPTMRASTLIRRATTTRNA